MVIFRVIRWRNLLSTGAQFTEIRLDTTRLTLVVGENGAGKSTILDAICLALFNKPFRDINKPQLINAVNQKNLLVEVEFDIGSRSYKVVRGMKPTVFEIYQDGKLVNQDADARDYQKYLEDQILKRNYKSFTQIDILGSASFTPFMQLRVDHRREVIEDLLDIKVFSTMNEVLKDKQTNVKNQVQAIENKIEVAKTKATLQQQYIYKLENNKLKTLDDNRVKIQESNTKIEALIIEVAGYKVKQTTLKQDVANAAAVRQKRQDINNVIKKLTDKIGDQEKNILFYSEHDQCPTCSQQLSEDIKKTAVDKHEHKIEEVNTAIATLYEQLKEIETKIEIIKAVEDGIAELQEKIVQLNSSIIAEQNYVQKLQKDISITDGKDGDVVEAEKKKLKLMAKEILQLSTDKSTLVEEKHYLDIAGILLKDTGIKTAIIKQYLPVINKLVNKYLQAMDLYVAFELDESFNEKIKSRHRDDFSYASFSEGEKARIDLSILFTWRAIAKMRSTSSTNLLLLDEVFDGSLNANGTDSVIEILNSIGSDTNVFIISHKDSLFDKFNSVIKFEKVNNFSVIKK